MFPPFNLINGFSGFTEIVNASSPNVNAFKSLTFSFSLSFIPRASIPKFATLSRTAFTPAPDPPDETYIVIFSAGRDGSTLSHVSYFSMNVVEILLITGASVDEPLKLICALTSDFAPADSPAFVSLFPQLAIIVRKIIDIKNVNVFFMSAS